MTTPTSAPANRGRAAGQADARSSKTAAGPARGRTAEAGEGATDQEMTRQVFRQTASDRAVEPFFERERDGAATEVEAAKAGADELT
ncbi:hypothetical protein [Pseudofrankia sp. DC12]|uniref:hypothetical protein n=1 Tax=Pseudofrankia sp. DC12 TaxID=683315 RepID=UPI0005F821CD|nr:hypothetical protein [Pseudofrankia sp. DC12]